ncbi:MAG: cytochrome bc complex cytochrome b subunit [Armatimonadetes bacterium]|nr:cytochrome bc complex cytochrome b subunit [Armatimonadota bacterium]
MIAQTQAPPPPEQAARPRLRERVYAWLDERTGLDAMLKMPMPRSAGWLHTLGGISFFLLLLQFGTGILLAMYYRPTPEAAYDSVRHIGNHVAYGWLIRGLHHWGANAMVLLVFLHGVRVLFYSAYKPPRELNWITGIGLMGVTLGFSFTGYLLPWDQLSYWATTVGTQLTDAVPIIGKQLLVILRGGEHVGGQTLTRFFAIHVVVLPLTALALLGIHFALERRLGLVEAPWRRFRSRGPTDDVAAPHGAGGEPFYPNHVWREGVVFCLVFALLLALIALLPPQLHPKANPAETPEHIKPEWYFLAAYQFLKLFPQRIPVLAGIPGVNLILGEGRFFSMVLQGLAMLALVLLPFLDRSPERDPRRRPKFTIIAVAGLLALLALTLWGKYS